MSVTPNAARTLRQGLPTTATTMGMATRQQRG